MEILLLFFLAVFLGGMRTPMEGAGELSRRGQVLLGCGCLVVAAALASYRLA